MCHLSRTSAISLITCCAVLAACGSDPDGAATGPTVTDSAGVTFIHNDIPDTAARHVPLIETVRIGSVEGEEHELLSRVQSLDVAVDGTVFVGNDQTGTVRMYDPSGAYVREFGGKGSGPAELSMVNLVLATDSGVAVIDWQRGGKVIEFDREGELLSSHIMMASDGVRLSVIELTPMGWLGRESRPGDYPRGTTPGQAYPMNADVHTVDLEAGEAGPAVYELPPNVLWGSSKTEGLDWTLFRTDVTPRFDAQGNLYRLGEGYRIDRYEPGRGLARVVTRTWTRKPITDADVDAFIDAVKAVYDTMSNRTLEQRRQTQERVEARIREQATFPLPEYQPPLGQLLVAHDGTMWVRRVDREPVWVMEARAFTGGFFVRPVQEPSEWDVFDPDGRYVATTVAPGRFAAMAATADALYGVIRDDLDVEYVIRLELGETRAP